MNVVYLQAVSTSNVPETHTSEGMAFQMGTELVTTATCPTSDLLEEQETTFSAGFGGYEDPYVHSLTGVSKSSA